MEITKREVIASIVIVATMLTAGFAIGDKIQDRQNDKNAEYQKAVHIEDTELFQYGMDTDIGNAFVYGDLKAIDTVTFDEIGGEYLYVEKVEEHYNAHTRTVTKRDANGNSHTETEIYYSWDYYNSWEKHSNEISFCGIKFDYNKISTPSSKYITTIKKWTSVRYKYYGVPITNTGTIYTKLCNGTIRDNSNFFKDCSIDEALKSCTTNVAIIIFWCVWIVLIGVIVCIFYYFDNKWLE